MIKFFKNNCKNLNPWQNIKILHTNIFNDIIAGIMVAIIVLPLALAFGEMSGLGPEAGIWSAVVGGIFGGLFGGCLVGVSGPTAPMASQVAAFMSFFVIGTTNEPDIVAAFTIIFLSGLILVGLSMINISRFIHHIPYSVIAGFMCGIGVIIMITQINGFVGIAPESNIRSIFTNFIHTIEHIQIDALYVSIPSLLILFTWSYIQKKYNSFIYIPSTLVALIIGTCIANFMDLNIPYIGDKMGDGSSHFNFYIPSFSRFNEFLGPAFALAGLAILDSLLTCKVADSLTGTRHNSNQEAFGQGIANMAAGLFGGIPTATATTQTIGNVTFGAKTPLSSITMGMTFLAILMGLGFLVKAIPSACLAAILFKLGIDILDYRVLPIIKKIPIIDLLIFSIVLITTIYADIMIAVAIGVVFSIVCSIYDIKLFFKISDNFKNIVFSNSVFNNHNDDSSLKLDLPIIILKGQGPLFFGSVESLLNTYKVSPEHKMLVVDMSDVSMIDLSGSFAIDDIIKKNKENNIMTYLYNANPQIKKILKNINIINHNDNTFCDSVESVNSIVKKHF